MEGVEQAFPGVVDGKLQLRGPVAFGAQNFAAHLAGGAGGIELDEEVEDALGFAAANCQHAVRWNGFDGLLEVVIHLESELVVELFLVRVKGLTAADDAFVVQQRAQKLAQIGVLAQHFSHDVACAFERVLDGRHFFVCVDERGREAQQRGRAGNLRPQVIGQGGQPAVARKGGLGAALGLVGQVQVFELGAVERDLDAGFELVVELALLKNRGQNGLASACKLAKVAELFLDVADLHLIQIASGFLAVTRDEGHGAAFVQERNDRAERGAGDIEGLCEVQQDFRGEVLCISHECSSMVPGVALERWT